MQEKAICWRRRCKTSKQQRKLISRDKRKSTSGSSLGVKILEARECNEMTCEYIERNALIVIKMTCEHMECIASIVIESGKYEYKYMKFDIHDSIDEGGVS